MKSVSIQLAVAFVLFLFALPGCSSGSREEVIQLGYGKEVRKSKVEQYAREEGVSYEKALERIKTAVWLDAGVQEVKKNSAKFGARP